MILGIITVLASAQLPLTTYYSIAAIICLLNIAGNVATTEEKTMHTSVIGINFG